MTVTLLQGDALEVLKTLPDCSVQTCVTSPPYYGLRDYGVDGQIGLETSPETYIAKLVDVFREVRRVLRDDGTCWINIGDSYFGSGKGGNPEGSPWAGFMGNRDRELAAMPSRSSGRRAKPYGTSGKAPASSQESGCLCGSLCDVCRVVYQNHRFRNDGLLVAMLAASLSETSREHKAGLLDHLPTSGSEGREVRTVSATLDQEHVGVLSGERLRAALKSTIGESSSQLLDECLQRDMDGACLLCGRPFLRDDLVSAHSDLDCTCGKGEKSFSLGGDTSGRDHSAYPYPYYSTEYHKPKDLIGVPWTLAFALRADGWYLRQDIIWHKPNPMPESVTDRCTKAHEYIFLLAKSQRYYYDADAISEPASASTHARLSQNIQAQIGSERVPGKTNGNMKAVGRKPKASWNGSSFDGPRDLTVRANTGRKMAEAGSGIKNNESFDAAMAIMPEYRNKRSVWTVTTKPYKEAHFATFPPDLIEPCILAGSKAGDTVLDPFNGSGTTCAVAAKHNRDAIGIELNPKYIELAQRRLAETQPILLGDAHEN